MIGILFPLALSVICGLVLHQLIKNKIAQMIEDESTRSPLSDSKIAEILSSEGITIARRTVAKYREELGIAPKNLRKRY